MLREDDTRRCELGGLGGGGAGDEACWWCPTLRAPVLHSWHVREPLLNDDLPSYILTGRITIRPGVKEFRDNSVLFHNYPEEEPVDIVVFCTGYSVSFPFLEESVVKVENKHASLYKHVFPTHLQKPTLAVLGFIKPFGPVMPVVEMQARWVSRVFKGREQM